MEEIENYETVILADGFEDAFIGIAERCAHNPVAVYDYERCVQTLMRRDGMTDEEACEWMEFNVLGTYVGDQTPWFLRLSLVESVKKISSVDMPIESSEHLADTVASRADELNLGELGAKDVWGSTDEV